jgi:ubiquinone/menaquinone biosynthesis C-methylase UbiE
MSVDGNREFNKVSRIYDKGRLSEDIAFWAIEAEKLAMLTSDSLVIDMGCGTGNYGLGIREMTGAVVVGFDPALGMLKQAKEKNPNFPVVRAAAEAMPFRSRVFDLVYAAQVWHHVQGRQKAADECFRVLKFGGTKIAHTIGHSQLHEKIIFKIFQEIKENQLRVYPSDDEFNTIFIKAGFKSVVLYPYVIERYQSTEELIEIAEKKLWSMFRPITQQGLENGVKLLRQWSIDHPGVDIRNDELITLFVARKQ